MSADGHMRAWVIAARRLLDGDDTDVIGARDALDKALAGPCRDDVSSECSTCGKAIEHRVGIWVHASVARDTHPALPTCKPYRDNRAPRRARPCHTRPQPPVRPERTKKI